MDIEGILLEQITLTRQEMQDLMATRKKNVTGRISGNFEEVRLGYGHVGIVGDYYAGVMEVPRKAGKVPKNFYLKIAEWARAKGLKFATDTEFNQFVYHTVRSISKHGFNPKYTEDIFSTPLAHLEERIGKVLMDEIEVEITNTIF